MNNPTYLGDAVYAAFDGFGIELRLNDHRGPCVVYLEPSTYNALKRWVETEVKPAQQPTTREEVRPGS